MLATFHDLCIGIIKHPQPVVYATANECVRFECDTKGTTNEQWIVDDTAINILPGVYSSSEPITDGNSTVDHHVLSINTTLFVRNNSLIMCCAQDEITRRVIYKSTSSLIIVGK